MERTGKLAFKPRLKRPQRRAAIEVAAAELFAARGYAASSVDEIASAAGVTKRVIYDHFESKRALHTELLDTHADGLIGSVAAGVGPGGEDAAGVRGAAAPDARLVAGVSAFFQFVEENPFAWRMLFRDAPADPVIAEVHRTIQRRATAAIAGILVVDIPPGSTDPGGHGQRVEMLAEMLKTSMNGLAGWWYEHQDVPRAQIVSAALDFAWTGLRALAAGQVGGG